MHCSADATNWRLPDGEPLRFWHPTTKFKRTLIVDQNHPDADDGNPGTAERPLRTIGAAAERAEPGDRVLVRPGTYRECVRPARSGTGPDAMISYEADGDVAITGGAVVECAWQPSRGWLSPHNRRRWHRRPDDFHNPCEGEPRIWMTRIDPAIFERDNPLAKANKPEVGHAKLQRHKLVIYNLRRGLVFQDGKRLEQVASFGDLYDGPGAFWPDPTGLVLHVRPHEDGDPRESVFELTAREQCFAPDLPELAYIRVKGFTMRRAGNAFPFKPQAGALSTYRGHHWIIEDNTIEWANGTGIDIGLWDARAQLPSELGGHLVRRNTIRHCGICGIAGLWLPDSLIDSNLIEDCCWHDVEEMYESSAIKFHWTDGTLISRNVIRRTEFGSGIWLDCAIKNTRVTRNVILDVKSRTGGIFIENSHHHHLVDNNVIVGCRRAPQPYNRPEMQGGHGMHITFTDHATVAHNLAAKCEGRLLNFAKVFADRMIEGRGPVSRRHRVLNNLFAVDAEAIHLQNADSTCEGNFYDVSQVEPGAFQLADEEEYLDFAAWQEFHGLDITSTTGLLRLNMDAETLTLRVDCEGDGPQCEVVEFVERDFFGRTIEPSCAVVGPFGALEGLASISIDPRAQAADEGMRRQSPRLQNR